jgi:hypothetical protein
MASTWIVGAASLVRSWTWLYTCGLPAAVRDARRAEIESDLWEFFHDPDRAAAVSSTAPYAFPLSVSPSSTLTADGK